MERLHTEVDLQDVDFLVIGSGIAGLTYALRTSQHGPTVILTKKNRAESSSNYAQGGIAGVMGEDDDVSLHIQDTLIAGAGLCHEDAVRVLVTEGPDRIRDLITLGARFSVETGEDGRQRLALGREGGHSRNRIVHAVDRTGWECERTLLMAAKDAPNLEVHDHYFVVDLLLEGSPRRCVGALALEPESGRLHFFRARAVLLATGGCGQVYLHTTNPPIATGDGVAMAWRAGATVANMEFIQFHPTSLYHPEGRSFLISEAVRGEGGILRTRNGDTFMRQYDERGELAPRDIVARAIHAERLKRGEPCVFLDVTHLDADFLRRRFPTIYERCLDLGVDITKQPIPVVPAAHYQCGGVQTDLNGQSSIPGLYAAGEVSCTGVHGANRLASNSLLEAMVYGRRAADAALAWATESQAPEGAPVSVESAASHPHPHRIDDLRAELQQMMNDDVGIVRNTRDLEAALARTRLLKTSVERLMSESRPDVDHYELRNLATVAELIIRSALSRHESRGLHFSTDYPATDDTDWRHDTVLSNDTLE